MASRRTMKRDRRRGRLPRCNQCRLPICWLSWRGHWRPYEPHHVDGRTHRGAPAHPVEAKKAWSFRELVEDLMVRREIGRDEAEDEAYAMPWFIPHVCPPHTKKEPSS